MVADAAEAQQERQAANPAYDPAKGVEGMHAMLDKGKKATDREIDELMPAIIDMFRKNRGADKELHEIDLEYLRRSDEERVVWLHKEASVAGAFRINSTGYDRQQSR